MRPVNKLNRLEVQKFQPVMRKRIVTGQDSFEKHLSRGFSPFWKSVRITTKSESAGFDWRVFDWRDWRMKKSAGPLEPTDSIHLFQLRCGIMLRTSNR